LLLLVLLAGGFQACAYHRCDPEAGCIPVRHTHRWFTVDRPLQGPLFAAGGPSPYDVEQGDVGSCWLLSAMAATAHRQPQVIRDRFHVVQPDLVEINFPEAGDTDGTGVVAGSAAGRAVVVSTRVPHRLFAATPLYARSRQGTWVSLLERAYARAFAYEKGYEGIGGDHPRTALARITGWQVEDYDIDGNLSGPDAAMEWQRLLRAFRRGAPMVAGSRIFQPRADIVPMHAYAVTGVFRDETGTHLVTLFDPESRADGKREVTLDLDDFSAYFFYVSIARPPQPATE
jgi:hypothetical protein